MRAERTKPVEIDDFLDAIRKSGITNARLGFASVINAVGQ